MKNVLPAVTKKEQSSPQRIQDEIKDARLVKKKEFGK
jgi:hypothetical protein